MSAGMYMHVCMYVCLYMYRYLQTYIHAYKKQTMKISASYTYIHIQTQHVRTLICMPENHPNMEVCADQVGPSFVKEMFRIHTHTSTTCTHLNLHARKSPKHGGMCRSCRSQHLSELHKEMFRIHTHTSTTCTHLNLHARKSPKHGGMCRPRRSQLLSELFKEMPSRRVRYGLHEANAAMCISDT